MQLVCEREPVEPSPEGTPNEFELLAEGNQNTDEPEHVSPPSEIPDEQSVLPPSSEADLKDFRVAVLSMTMALTQKLCHLSANPASNQIQCPNWLTGSVGTIWPFSAGDTKKQKNKETKKQKKPKKQQFKRQKQQKNKKHQRLGPDGLFRPEIQKNKKGKMEKGKKTKKTKNIN